MSTQAFTKEIPSGIQIALDHGALMMAPGDHPEICPNCGGFGVILAYKVDAGPFKQPAGVGSKWMTIGEKTGWWKGNLVSDHCPVCQDGRMALYLEERCGLEGSDLTVTAETFRTDGIYERKAPALADIRRLLAMNHQPSGMVTLLGEADVNHGVGKSHLAKALVNGFRAIGVWSRYTTLADLLADLSDRYGKEAQLKTEDIIEAMQRMPVLVVDEIDKVELTGWNKQAFFRLMDYRTRHANEMLTVLIANAYQEDGRLWIYDHDPYGNIQRKAWPAELGYLSSRIQEGLVITVAGPDYRQVQGYIKRQQADEMNEQQEEEAWSNH